MLFLLGVFMSAFFSGSETGFYQASRVRLVIDALDGDKFSKYLLRLVNNPALFVATTLIGNNVANYIVSLAILLGSRSIWINPAAEMVFPILLAPVLFVYGELLPKSLFFQAPNRLLRFNAPLFLVFTCLFAPIAAAMWGFGRLLEKSLGQAPAKIRLTLARKEIQQVLQEGLEAGILHPTQRYLGQNFFIVAAKPVKQVCTPLARVQSFDCRWNRRDLLRQATRKKLADIPLWKGTRSNLIGYVRTVDMLVQDSEQDQRVTPRTFLEIQGSELFGEALMKMQAKRETLARVVGSGGKTIGLLSIDQLTDPLLKGPLVSLRR
jgi:CBS domain containing-hemolysin-like protein